MRDPNAPIPQTGAVTNNTVDIEEDPGARPQPAIPISPLEMIGAVFSAIRSDCACRTCKILRGMADKMAAVLIPLEEDPEP